MWRAPCGAWPSAASAVPACSRGAAGPAPIPAHLFSGGVLAPLPFSSCPIDTRPSASQLLRPDRAASLLPAVSRLRLRSGRLVLRVGPCPSDSDSAASGPCPSVRLRARSPTTRGSSAPFKSARPGFGRAACGAASSGPAARYRSKCQALILVCEPCLGSPASPLVLCNLDFGKPVCGLLL